jgi:hypothetical protein
MVIFSIFQVMVRRFWPMVMVSSCWGGGPLGPSDTFIVASRTHRVYNNRAPALPLTQI